jgi:hypothetical protein
MEAFEYKVHSLSRKDRVPRRSCEQKRLISAAGSQLLRIRSLTHRETEHRGETGRRFALPFRSKGVCSLTD